MKVKCTSEKNEFEKALEQKREKIEYTPAIEIKIDENIEENKEEGKKPDIENNLGIQMKYNSQMPMKNPYDIPEDF